MAHAYNGSLAVDVVCGDASRNCEILSREIAVLVKWQQQEEKVEPSENTGCRSWSRRCSEKLETRSPNAALRLT